jgi:hypothetical protein
MNVLMCSPFSTGGCYVEGTIMKNAFRWRDSVGPYENRPGHYGDVWNYWTDDGFGFYEGLQVRQLSCPFSFLERNKMYYAIWAWCGAFLNWTPTFEWYMSRFVVKYFTKKDTCYREIALRAQSKLTTLASIVCTVGRAYVITARESSLH